MLVVFRVMPAIVRPLPLSHFAMNIFRTVNVFRFAHYSDFAFDIPFPEGSRLSHESVNHLRVVLRKYGWNDIPLR